MPWRAQKAARLGQYPTGAEIAIETALPLPNPTVRIQAAFDRQLLTWYPVVDRAEKSAWHAFFTAAATSNQGQSPDRVIAEVSFPAESVWYLNSCRELVPLAGEVHPPWPVGCFAVLAYRGSLFQVRLDPVMHLRLKHRNGNLTVDLTLRDRAACGLRMWGEQKLARSPFQQSLRISVSRLAQASDALWTEPFPGSARSVICITDHADWDSIPKATALHELFASHDLRITKGVFPVADPGWDYGPGLDSPKYSAVIDQWFRSGHEIAYHGLGSGDHAPTDLDECLRRIDQLDPYNPETWIDHSIGEYTFARTAQLPGGAHLPQILAAKGVRNLWSYTDVWQNPATHLHLSRPRGPASAFGDSFRLAWRRGLTGPLQYAYLGSIPVKNLTGDAQYRRVLRQPWSFSEWAGLATNYGLLRELNRRPLCLYGMGGDTYLQDLDGPLIFDTILLNHVTLQLCPANVERLVRDNGVLIAHTYLAALHKKGGRNCFRVDREAEFLSGFRENIDHISALQKRGDVLTLPLRDLRKALVHHAEASLVRTEEGWEVRGDVTVSSSTPYRIEGDNMTMDRHGAFSAKISGAALLANP